MDRGEITGVVLAGGLGRRMGGVDKGLQELDGRPLVAHIIARLQPQVGPLLINANRNAEVYARFGCPVVADAVPDFAGPLAGLHAALAAASTPWVVTVPCDSPFLPADLVSRLAGAVEQASAGVAVARTGDQVHPVFCLCRRELRDHLGDYLARGERKFTAWYASLATVEVTFDDQPAAFENINTVAELASYSRPL